MKRRGYGLVELVVGVGLISMTLLTILSLFVGGIRTFQRQTAQVDLSQKNAQGMRRVSDTLRQAMSATISSDGKTINYVMPARSANVDAITGERELIDPMVGDGVARSFSIVSGNLQDQTGRIYVRNITDKDPLPSSSQYNQVYKPFTLTTIGSRRAITFNLITAEKTNSGLVYIRMKNTAMLRNGN